MEHSHSRDKSWLLIIFLIYFEIFPWELSLLGQKKSLISTGAPFVQNKGMYNRIISS